MEAMAQREKSTDDVFFPKKLEIAQYAQIVCSTLTSIAARTSR